MHRHKWNESVKKDKEEKPLSKSCDCGETIYLYHLQHAGISWDGYRKEIKTLSREEIKSKTRRDDVFFLSVLGISIGVSLFLRYFNKKVFDEMMNFNFVLFGFNIPSFVLFALFFLILFYWFSRVSWNNIMLHAEKVV